ncbi:hypothetical protein ACQP1P_18470 [Dactylosporangium sp. CA-052675]|uniref:hypothetical protein n=1 Tax=Dactylosporangium sp. CA-052675 TaxID=3239927 RepID=UPI003D92251E
MIEDTLRRYARQDPPPSPLRAADVLVEARRRTRRRGAGAGVAATAATALAAFGLVAAVRAMGPAPVGPAGPGCVVDVLDLPSGTAGGVTAVGIDPSGRYVIGLTGQRDAPRAVLWIDDAAAVLPEPFTPQAVNPSGLVVGFTGPDRHGFEAQQRPVAYDGTRLLQLPLPGGASGGAAYAVNTHGDVLGTVARADGTWLAVRWRTTGGTAIVTTVASASGLGLTDDGIAVGFDQGARRALRWTADGATTALPLPRGAESATATAAAGEWAAGDVTAPVSDSKGDDTHTAARWNLRTGAVEAITGLSGRRVSATGVVAGTTGSGAPALWRDGEVRTLPLPGGAAPAGSTLSGITADGQTLVGGVETGPNTTAGPVGDPVVSGRTAPVVWRGC